AEKPVNLAELIPSLAKYVEEKIQESIGNAPLTSHSQGKAEINASSSVSNQQKNQEQTETPSRYDDLLNNLSQEEAERQKKKLQREAARKKLDNLEFNRREQNLDAKQQKI